MPPNNDRGESTRSSSRFLSDSILFSLFCIRRLVTVECFLKGSYLSFYSLDYYIRVVAW